MPSLEIKQLIQPPLALSAHVKYVLSSCRTATNVARQIGSEEDLASLIDIIPNSTSELKVFGSPHGDKPFRFAGCLGGVYFVVQGVALEPVPFRRRGSGVLRLASAVCEDLSGPVFLAFSKRFKTDGISGPTAIKRIYETSRSWPAWLFHDLWSEEGTPLSLATVQAGLLHGLNNLLLLTGVRQSKLLASAACLTTYACSPIWFKRGCKHDRSAVIFTSAKEEEC